MDIETLLCEEIKRDLKELETLEVDSDAYKVRLDVIAKLTDRAIELEKITVDSDEKAKNREGDLKIKEAELALKENQLKEQIENQKIEFELRRQQMDDERKNRLVYNSIAVAGIIIPSLITIWGTVKSFEFEKEGTVTTIMGRGFINKLLPKK
jgi:hypothetical protein